VKPWIPRLSQGRDLLALQLGPVEGFVLSRIDGNTDVEQLGLVTGLTAARLEAILDRLVSEGAVEAPRSAPPGAPARRLPEPEAPRPHEPPAPHLPSPEPGEDPLAGLLDSPLEQETPAEEAPAEETSEEETQGDVEDDSIGASPRRLFETRLHPLP